ncbi:Ubiquitin- modifier 1 [Coemansia sp. RSA 1822]|nr:Ubiquitin- modifier 1 [Coemansia sp. RSA 638]KAJ2483229.1 Ubiquitin- modifier 1 [Coemansia sp. RSA 2131]KAJ2544177.1 Ubiquitin- modifier 1 [Coemansia sp. RSA 1853]KAJ2565811.1 Ubiquitin- modifier 1 [Coemansia sp. RSA 1822]KAJ2656016.1 Ubiquitin- modifier 1 [Coemansia sp. RSA 1199]
MSTKLTLYVEFSDGLDTLIKDELLKKVDGRLQATLTLDSEHDGPNIRDLVEYIRDNCIKRNPELFYMENGVRPGILVLVNDVDWELTDDGVDKYDQKLENNDNVVFISTLHGG